MPLKLVALVDDEDYNILRQFKWNTTFVNGNAYAMHSFIIDDKQKGISMHRFIMNVPDGLMVDHVDGNGLNNQKSNLRFCTKSQNAANSRTDKVGISKFKGVTKQKGRNSFTTVCNGKYIGSFKTEIEAAEEYDKHAHEIFKEFARLNFPDKFKKIRHKKAESN